MLNMMNIFNIQPFSTGDGKGIRTTVFMGGCNLRCPWCHNPECFSNKKELSVEDVEKKILHDKDYYEASGGGVTFSGGEPLLRFTECIVLLEMAKKHGLNVCLDTAFSVNIPDMKKLSSLVDTFLIDLKTADPDKFLTVCGGDFSLYESNVKEACEMGLDYVFRIPLIPDFNTDADSLEKMVQFITKYPAPVSFHPFHKMGVGKYKDLGLEYAYSNKPLLATDEVRVIKDFFLSRGIQAAEI